MVIDSLPRGQSLSQFIEKTCGTKRDWSVIVLDDNPTVDSVVESLHCGVADFIRKPATAERLSQALLNLAEERGLLGIPKDFLTVIGERMRRRRKELLLSLRDLSRRTGLSVSLLSQIERARSSASLASFNKIARALGTSMSILFEGV